MDDHYAILGVSRDATVEEIKAAYKTRLKLYHPDKHDKEKDPELIKVATEMTRKVQEAYDALIGGNVGKRKEEPRKSGEDDKSHNSTASPQPVPNGLEFETGGGSVTITRYTGKAGVVDIPERIQGLPVRAIGGYVEKNNRRESEASYLGVDRYYYTYKGSFEKCETLISVTIPSSVIFIGRKAFSQCGGLASVTIPSSVTSIGESAFSECYSLKSVRLSRHTEVFDKEVFPPSTKITYID